jgi:hypothetical protein
MLPMSVPEMKQLDMNVLNNVRAGAAGMTEEEVCDWLSLSAEDFSDEEKLYFKQFYNFGRGTAIQTAVDRLFQQMNGRNGAQASLAYLRHFAEKFPSDEKSATGDGFNFRVVLDD